MGNGQASNRRYTAVKTISLLAGLALLIACGTTGPTQPARQGTATGQATETPQRTFKVLHVMSYHSDWKWNEDQFGGFKDALSDLDVEYRVIEMDTKRHSSPEWMNQVSQQAMDVIDTWQPDLVYTNDDAAQEYVTSHYVNTDVPFVFSAVNADPSVYGFTGSTNVTGVLEQEHFVESVHLLQQIAPDVAKIAVIVDDDPMWDPVIARMQAKQEQLPGVEFVSWDVIQTYAAYQRRVVELQSSVDAIGLIGIFRFKDESGENVPYQEVLQWTAENSNLPDFTFWEDRISYGTLCTVTVSGYEQGLEAGQIARGILVEGKSPSSYPMEPSVKGEPVVSLARARKLGIHLKSSTLLSVKVVKKFAWEE
jgi:ABC-type uncharacterized transport system substrate-binding protein